MDTVYVYTYISLTMHVFLGNQTFFSERAAICTVYYVQCTELSA
jgi:hypothetical protein